MKFLKYICYNCNKSTLLTSRDTKTLALKRKVLSMCERCLKNNMVAFDAKEPTDWETDNGVGTP